MTLRPQKWLTASTEMQTKASRLNGITNKKRHATKSRNKNINRFMPSTLCNQMQWRYYLGVFTFTLFVVGQFGFNGP